MRTLARVVPLGLVAVMLSAPGVTPAAFAAPVPVTITPTGYEPTPVTVPLDGSVTWTNHSGETQTTRSDQGFFYPQLEHGFSVEISFEHAGTFGYYSQQHPTRRGSVRVPLKAPAGAANGFTLRWSAVDSFRSGRTFDVQMNPPGTATGWTALKTNVTARYAFLNPARNGVWRYRARLDNTSNGKSSGWSPEKRVTVS